jgi:hypothetical protein
MSDQPTQLESDGYPRSESSTGFSANGTDPVEATAAAPESEATDVAPEVEATATEGESAAEAIAEPAASEADATATEGEPAEAAVAEATAETPADDESIFLAALARAMQTTAEAEKARLIAEMDARRDALISAVRARRESESSRMRELADEDLRGIDTWATAERERIQAERERRAQVVRADLELSLTQHGAKIDREIEVVEAAIMNYRADVDAFFANLERETPLAIAQQAGRRPVFPSIEALEGGSAASESAPAESAPAESAPTDGPTPEITSTAGVGVMDAESLAQPVGSWRAWTEMSASADANGPVVKEETTESTEPEPEPVQVPVASSSHQSDGPGLVHSLPVSRPMSWLRRDHQNDDPNS